MDVVSMSNWDSLTGELVDGAFAVEKLISHGDDSALFRARDIRVDPPREVLLAIFRNASDDLLKRYQEAAFLRHRHILRIWQTGRMGEPGTFYAASEPAEYDLPQFLEHRPMPVEDAKELAEQVIDALEYLHQYGLVFCGLRTEGIWKNGNDWLLADFRELRVAGEATPRDMQHALARNPEVPPEAFQGIISPAWDVWSLGVLLRTVLTPEPHHVPGSLSAPMTNRAQNGSLPAPFDEIVRDCLDPNPDSRITTRELLKSLPTPSPEPSSPAATF